MIGTRVGHYEVTRHLGTGGMGEVYQATDTKLGRPVAIKRLPAVFASDPDRLARFRREAQVLASLNHPNIAHVYGLEESGDTQCIVMELVEGETLQERIARGPVPVDAALTIATQIADALTAAHDKGVVHRDLKPGNVMLTPDGQVKVLDFGLAKAYDAAPSSAASADSPTVATMAATQMGVILGTAAYMAPEQARGKVVDRRADIWAFGVVLFEMLTGRRAFDGDDLSDTMANVLKMEPDWTKLPAGVPPRVRSVLRTCLLKDPKQRMGDAQSVRLALDGAFDTAAPSPAVALPSVAPRRPLVWMVAFALALIAAVALSFPAMRYLGQTSPPETRVDIVTPATGQPISFALSPDGRQIVFVALDDKASRLWLRSLSSTTAQPLAGTEGATYPFWSPDSRSIGFFAPGAMKRLDLGGGGPKMLTSVVNGGGGTWSADGVIVFAASLSGTLMRMPAAGGTAAPVTTLGAQQFGHFNPQFLPDGTRLLFTVGGAPEASGIYMVGLDGSSPTRLVSDFASAVYAPAGWMLWVRAGALTAQRLDADRPALTGEPVVLADGVATDTGSLRSAVSVAMTGLVAYRTAGGAQRQLTWFDRSGTARGVVGEPDDTWFQPRVSPDGRRVAVARTVQGNTDLWLLDGARASRFTFGPGQDLFPVWSHDGARIAYMSRQSGIGDLFQKLTSGAGVEEPLLNTGRTLSASSWSADGRFLMYISIDAKTSGDIWVLPMSGADRTPFVFLSTPFREVYGAFSPDGRWVAYHSNESGRPEVYVRPFVPPSRDASASASATADKSADKPAGTNPGTAATAGGQWQISTAGGIHATWRSDGKELYYVNPDGAMMAATIKVTGAALEPGAPVMLFPTRMVGGGADIQNGRQYDVTADGRFLINTLLNEAAAPITLLQNWNGPAK
jgi:serine/threonine protein kinase/Tol biopolymer transport system component